MAQDVRLENWQKYWANVTSAVEWKMFGSSGKSGKITIKATHTVCVCVFSAMNLDTQKKSTRFGIEKKTKKRHLHKCMLNESNTVNRINIFQKFLSNLDSFLSFSILFCCYYLTRLQCHKNLDLSLANTKIWKSTGIQAANFEFIFFKHFCSLFRMVILVPFGFAFA